ncbi:helix-turn-helix domain-containing protein [Actinospica sp.]|jgi:transposase-like protein|uniref:helix-turn-helix domain-containing protein n=1 Tax=Actinospica sp. TaxID=1872142 RepID=UPI002B8ACEB7|nr:helix-turn-helix domain-containing protein [Actinospica sp.]HWG22895.1 helix-turn-helix domain-containing protein [Actinospica sp.]
MPQLDARADQRLLVAMAALTTGASAAQIAREHKVSEASVAKWKKQFIEGGARSLGALHASQSRVAELEAEVRTLRKSLREAKTLLAVWRHAVDNQLGRLADLDAVRREAKISVVSFCTLVGIPRRTYYRYLDKARDDSSSQAPKGPWPAPVVDRLTNAVQLHLEEHPDDGHRKVHSALRAQGYQVSPSSVLRAMRRLESGTPSPGWPVRATTRRPRFRMEASR